MSTAGGPTDEELRNELRGNGEYMSRDLDTEPEPQYQRRTSSGSTLQNDNTHHGINQSHEEGPPDEKDEDGDNAERPNFERLETGKSIEPHKRPVGFWHSSLRSVRLTIFKKWLITTVILMTFILTVLSLYWGALFGIEQKFHKLTVAVVSFDGQGYPVADPVVGNAVTQAAQELSEKSKTTSGILGFRVDPPEDYNNDPTEVRRAVYDEHVWVAIYVNANATYLLQQAVETGNQSYDPLGAMQQIYIQARDQESYASYILPQIQKFTTELQATFGQKWINSVLSNTSLSADTYSPTPAISIGLIYLIIISFFTFSFYLPIHSSFLIPKEHPPLHFYQLIIWRLLATIAVYFILSLAYSLVSLAFQIPFSNDFPTSHTERANNPDLAGHATFMVYWMLNFLGMFALGLASENVAMIIGQPWAALWLIFWVITNVATSFYQITLANDFFTFGYAWPLHNIVEASRTILFDTHSRLGLNFGILVVWCVVNSVVFVPCAMFMRWKAQKQEFRERAHGIRKKEIRYLVDG